jgi:sugar lactone lactonase YvrE
MKNLVLILLCLAPLCAAFGQWTNGQAAEAVLCQPDYLTNTSGLDSQRVKAPFGLALDLPNGKIYVVDKDNHRVLRFAYPFSTMDVAEVVFGQPDFHTGAPSAGATGLTTPMCATVFNGDLWITDSGNSRVLCFKSAYAIVANQSAADIVLGQPSPDSVTAGTSQSKLSHPRGLCFDAAGNLWVADALNNRVVQFENASELSTGSEASLVLGQQDFDGAGSGTNAGTMFYPSGIVAGTDELFVADLNNHRILRFDTIGDLQDGDDASGVLGQPDFVSGLTHRGGAANANTLSNVYGLALDGSGRLYAADMGANRVMIFDGAASMLDGADATSVLGQSLFTTTASATTAEGHFVPSGVCVDMSNNKVLVVERDNRRIVQYGASSPLPVTIASLRLEEASGALLLRWSTVSETNNFGFTVQFAPVGGAFADIPGSFIAGNGTTVEHHDYAYTLPPAAVAGGRVRVKQVDLGGTFHYSDPVVVTRATSIDPEEPIAYGLEQNYPNPFNPTTEIQYTIHDRQSTSIKVFDLLGREVASLVNEVKAPGRYSVTWNATGMASGVYFCRLTSGGLNRVRAMVLAK